MVFCAATNCSNSFKSSISMFDFPKDDRKLNIMRYILNDKTFTRLYGVRTISQKTALNKISRQEVRWFRLSSLGDDLKKDTVPRIFNFKIGIGQKRSHGKNHPCPPKSGTTLQGNSESVRSALSQRRKLKI